MSDPFTGFNGLFAQQPAPATQPPNPYGTANPNQDGNPFAAAYGTQAQQQPHQQQAMVASGQPTNQWGMQNQNQSYVLGSGYPQQQQQHQQQVRLHSQQTQQRTNNTPSTSGYPGQLTPTTQSVASNYMTPGMGSVNGTPMQSPQNSMMMPPSGHQQQMYTPGQIPQNGYANPYPQQQQQQQQQQPPPVPAQPPTIKTTSQEDDDFFGAFSTNKAKTPPQQSSPTTPRPPTEFETDYTENVSVLSKSTNASNRTSSSPLDDPKFAPKPPKPHGLDNARALAHNAPPGTSVLPDFDLVTHSGYAQARISFRTILIKKWKQIFWITYGVNKLLVFRSSADFEDWISNPYLNKAQREFLVKLEIDLVEDLSKPNVRGYQVTNQRLKNYNNQALYQFKIERWMDYGPTIAAAFGSPNEREIFQLRTIFSEMLKRSPSYHNQKVALLRSQTAGGTTQAPHLYPSGVGMGVSPSRSTGSGHNQYNHHQHHYSSNASTGMLYEQETIKSSKSYGVLSTGPVERHSMRDPTKDAIAGYQPTSRNGFQY